MFTSKPKSETYILLDMQDLDIDLCVSLKLIGASSTEI
jgi:hypothetical protein